MKLIGVSVMAAGCLTAAVAGYVVLREPKIPVEVVEAVTLVEQEPAEPEAAEPTPIPAPAPPTPSASAPAELLRTSPTPPTPSASAPAELLRTSPTPPTPPTSVRYVPDLTPTPPQGPAPVSAPEPAPELVEVTVERNSVIGIRLDSAVSTKTARAEDRISATVSREVTVGGRVAIPVGARLEGTVTTVDRGGRFRERPRLGLRFDTMILTDGTRLSIGTDTIFREGDSPSADATARVGTGAVAGAILGGVLGGKKGAILGGAAGAAGGAATVVSGDANETALREGAPLTVRLTEDLTVIVQK